MRKGGGVMGSNNGSMLVANTADGSRPGYGGPQDWGQEAKAKGTHGNKKSDFDQSDLSNPYSNASQKKQSAENKAIAKRHAKRIKDKEYRDNQLEAVRRLTNPNVFERFSDYRKKSNKNWATKQKQKQELAITKFLEDEYEISKYCSPRMIDIEEVKEQLRSQYDPQTNTMKGLEGFNKSSLSNQPFGYKGPGALDINKNIGMNFGKTQLGPLGLKNNWC